MLSDHLNFRTAKEVAQILRLNLLTVYEYIRNGSLPTVRFGRSYRIADKDLEQFIADHLTSKKNDEKTD